MYDPLYCDRCHDELDDDWRRLRYGGKNAVQIHQRRERILCVLCAAELADLENIDDDEGDHY